MKVLILLSLLTFGTSKAFALPLLAESAALNVSSNLTLYPDHEDKNKFYFFPNSSRISSNDQGLPMFSFTHWGLKSGPLKDAGAYMVFTNRLDSDRSQKEAIEAFLDANPAAGVAVLPVQSSMVGIQSESETTPLSRLFSELNFARVGGRAEDEIGVTSILTGLGAKVLLKAVETPNFFTFNYCYKVVGLGPSFDAKIHVKWDKVYDHFRASVSTGRWWWKANITHEVEKLRQSNLVSWEINGGDATDEEYVKMITAEIVKRLFVNELQYVPAGQTSRDSGWGFLRLNFAHTRREEHKEETWLLKKRLNIHNEHCTAVSLRGVNNHY